jgi:hypothetical protein
MEFHDQTVFCAKNKGPDELMDSFKSVRTTMTWEEMKEEHRADAEALERLIRRLRDDV